MPNLRSHIVRKSFGRMRDIVPIPNLIEIQSTSFNDFVQLDMLPEERRMIGLEKALKDVFPIQYEDKLSLEYVSYELGNWACTCGKLTGIYNRYQWECSDCGHIGCSFLTHGSCTVCHKKTAFYKTCADCLSRVTLQLSMTLDECRTSGQTFSLPLRVTMQLVTWASDGEQEDSERHVRDIKEQNVFFVDLPVMADLYESNGRIRLGNLGTFLINGIDRVVVSQLHRSPGVVFAQSKKNKDYRGKPYYVARLIPMRGSWMDFEFDSNDFLYVKIDKKKKILVTTFLQALGYSRNDILQQFYHVDVVIVEKGSFKRVLDETVLGQRIEKEMLPSLLEEELLGQRITATLLDYLKKKKISALFLRDQSLLNRVLAQDLIDEETGEILLEQGTPLNEVHLEVLKSNKNQTQIKLIQASGYVFQPVIALTLSHDKCFSQDDALRELHIKLWPGDSVSIKEVKERLDGMLFNPRFYDLTKVGRIRMNRKLGLEVDSETFVLTKEDIVATIKYLVGLRERGEGELDDIDHLGNRRTRLVGELLLDQVLKGFGRIERIVRERFRIQETHAALMPQDFLNVKPLGAVIREFFGLGQLSQFMDQTNPLAEIAHKRRLSALGPGGVLKDRATFEVRDVHPSHYGRICPIETPEGQTVGLISSLATYATVNDLGFIETAYRPIVNGQVADSVIFFDAFEESSLYIAQSDEVNKKEDKLIKEANVFARHQGNFVTVGADKITHVDLSPKQLVSVSAALIPFLEHDDAVRALMGANMQRQSIPLIKPQVPIVGTGMESEIVKASGSVISALRGGVVEYISSEKIVIRTDENEFHTTEEWISNAIDTYYLKKFQRSSYSTWIHHQPCVVVGQKIKSGEIITSGAAIKNGELALGVNLLVAFMPWHGYNFEDAIVLNSRLVHDDALTSIHIDEYIADARDTKMGPEEITKDIPNVSDSLLANLDEDGIVRVGTRVKAGDILVGKVTLKGDVQYSPEEKLLRAIFGEKSREVRDTSLRVPSGVEGTVVDIKVFARGGVRKSKRYKQDVDRQIEKMELDHQQHLSFLYDMVRSKAILLLKTKVDTKQELFSYNLEELCKQKVKDKTTADLLRRLKNSYEVQVRVLVNLKEDRINRLKKGDTLPSGVIKMVKVYIAMKRHISVGDKIAGRHGNKGVVSILVPREDMPCMQDGTPVDIVLNPLGIPSRMNVGQILETLLGFAGRKLGEQLQESLNLGYEQIKKDLGSIYGHELIKEYELLYGKNGLEEMAKQTVSGGVLFKTPVFESASLESDIQPLLKSLQYPVDGAFMLRDGRTGEYFDQPVTVGTIYIMKLNHMVDDKLHARSVGPYSLVTQQPLGGKAKQGGQRLGEMEVWALEAYGAAYTLQEMLTYKSDDIVGRHKVYQSIVRGETIGEPGVPESFNVLIKELQSLGLEVALKNVCKEYYVD